MELSREKILVVDDEDAVRTLLSLILEKQGYQVLRANSGAQAIDIYNRDQGEIGMIITDIRMPGMTGTELVERLTGAGCRAPVLFISAFPEHANREQLRGERRQLLEKPFSPDALLASVRQMLAGELRKAPGRAQPALNCAERRRLQS